MYTRLVLVPSNDTRASRGIQMDTRLVLVQFRGMYTCSRVSCWCRHVVYTHVHVCRVGVVTWYIHMYTCFVLVPSRGMYTCTRVSCWCHHVVCTHVHVFRVGAVTWYVHMYTCFVLVPSRGMYTCARVSSWYCLAGLVVKASASGAEDPGFESRFATRFFWVESFQ